MLLQDGSDIVRLAWFMIPKYEAQGNYVPSIISERYDAFVFIDETKALTPLQFE